MKRQHSIRLVDQQTGDGYWYQMETVNHDLKMNARKNFAIDCAFCHTESVQACETHIQHGLYESKFWEYVYCPTCEKVTLHIYTVLGDENGH